VSYLGDLLFVRRDRVDLDTVLRHRGDVLIRELVDRIPASAFASQTDEQVAQEVYNEASMKPLDVAFDKAKAAVEEVLLDVTTVFGERARVRGLRATKTIPFIGSPDLWQLQTNPFDLNPPHGSVRGQTVIVGIDVREQESEQAKHYINDTITKMKTYLERQTAQIAAYNQALPTKIAPVIQQRRARMGSASDLLKKLQG